MSESSSNPPALPDIRTVRDLSGRYVLLRAALNVPVQDGVAADTFRIERALPTIEYLRAQGARVVLIAHIGRKPDESLSPVFNVLAERVPSLRWCGELLGPRARSERKALDDGDVLLLENVRSAAGETRNDAAFARELASYGECYVNDAFADSHRAHASIVGVPSLLPSYFGGGFCREYEALRAARTPDAPSLFILGGAKFETKLPLVRQFLSTYNHVFIGGALAHDVWRARGYEIGTSLTSDVDLKDTGILEAGNVLLPVDVTVVGADYTRVTTPDDIRPDEKIVDAGPLSVDMITNYALAARSVLWNGPLGDYERGFATATREVAQSIAAAPAYSVVGGGDTVASIRSLCIEARFGFVSSAGGAMLTYLETGTLPAIEAVTSGRAPR